VILIFSHILRHVEIVYIVLMVDIPIEAYDSVTVVLFGFRNFVLFLRDSLSRLNNFFAFPNMC
jgi:hypothetical protein